MYLNENELLNKIGAGIRLERKRNGLSQQELARYAGVHKNFIGSIERGEQAPTVITLNRICAHFGMGLGEFFEQVNV